MPRQCHSCHETWPDADSGDRQTVKDFLRVLEKMRDMKSIISLQMETKAEAK
jgi:hypothetical protein